jgi:hypothetical protein
MVYAQNPSIALVDKLTGRSNGAAWRECVAMRKVKVDLVGNHPLRRMLCRCILVISGVKTLLEIIGSNQLSVKKWAKDVD